MLTKAEINELKRARKYCITNARFLAWGSDTEYPAFDDIKKADRLLDLAAKIDRMILAEVGGSAD